MLTLNRIPSDYRFATSSEWDCWNGGGKIPDSLWVRRSDGGVDMAVPKTIPIGWYF